MADEVESFLQSILRSGLLDEEELEGALRVIQPSDQREAGRLAERLIHLGKLSRFQARKLLQGATVGLLLGPYQILSPIGRGGMGIVYLARDARDARLVAVKVLPPKRARAEDRLLARFQREMALSQRVNHPHLAKTFEAGVVQGVYYLAMEFIPGQSLHRHVLSKGVLSVALASRLFTEAASALEHAHQIGLIHRDLKPSNIMVTPREHAKVLDLGLALMQGEVGDIEIVGGRGYLVGSAGYMAPEQTYDATRVDPRTDVYALGCTLYFALSGASPLGGTTALEKIEAHRREKATPLQEHNPEVPAGLARLIHRMMAKRPADRLPSMAAVQEALKPWCPPEEIEAADPEEDASMQSTLEALEKSRAVQSLADFSILRPVKTSTGKNGGDSSPDPETIALAEIHRRVQAMRRIGYLVAGVCGAMVLILAVVVLLLMKT